MNVSVNGHEFALGDGFPSTGFKGAEFTLVVAGVASHYNWSSNAAWVGVDSSGKVSFTAQGNASPVTITATPKSGGTALTYTFTLRDWFISNGDRTMSWFGSESWCAAQGFSQPSRAQLTQGQNIRAIGSLWSEWGRIFSYSSSDFIGIYSYWTSEAVSPGYLYAVALSDGRISASDDIDYNSVACWKGL